MPLSTEKKKVLIDQFKQHEGDTGSPEVQVALLHTRIQELTDHLRIHKKDHHSRRGLMMMVGQRKAMLKYLKTVSVDRYNALTDRLGLRRS